MIGTCKKIKTLCTNLPHMEMITITVVVRTKPKFSSIRYTRGPPYRRSVHFGASMVLPIMGTCKTKKWDQSINQLLKEIIELLVVYY